MEEIPRATQQSLNGVDQVASIVKAMKQFAHPEQDNLAIVDINAALQQTALVARNEWKYVADLDLDLDPEKPTVEGYPGPLNQVFLNIIVNAAQAIEERVGNTGTKGRIAIRTGTDETSALIEISDTGNGMEADRIDRIFDPFFTTKEVGKGTGQGLAIAYDIIANKHGGTIDVASTVGRGTSFTIRLPLRRSS
jgi:signal transduction histidine kinase